MHNQDASRGECESRQPGREKIVPGGAKVVIFIGPLKPGRYEFWGEYHDATAKGVVIGERMRGYSGLTTGIPGPWASVEVPQPPTGGPDQEGKSNG